MKKIQVLVFSMLIISAVAGCGGGSSSDSAPAVNEGENAAVTVTMQASYGDSGSVSERSMIPTVLTGAMCTDTETDSPGYVPGTDCDSDSGTVAYLDPSGFKVAIKRLSFVKNDSTMVDLIPDTGLLSDAVEVDLSEPVQLDVSEIPQGIYTAYYAEFYYYELTMNIYGVQQQVRVYLSDDDFVSEGSLGNHQGDVKLLDSSDNFGFVYPGLAWTEANLVYVRTDDIRGMSSADPETGHMRGLYGSDDLWNGSDFMQGADQDIFIVNDILSMTGVTVGSGGSSVTITFDMDDTWFFEDFNDNGDFEPCTGVEACADNAEWTPVFPGIDINFE